ncbi:MAG: hypothetical protein AB8C84_10370 [Oligoflexales bacterium]
MNIQDLYQKRDSLFVRAGSVSNFLVVAGILVGVLSFAAGMSSGDHVRTWGSFIFNLFFFFCIALGGVAFGGMQDLVGAIWGRAIKRSHEAMGAFLPLAGVFFTIFFLCIQFRVLSADQVYPWIADPHMLDHFPGKNVWLQQEFMLIRDVFAVVVIVALCKWLTGHGLRSDKIFLEGRLEEAQKLGEENRKKVRYWAAPVMFVLSCMFSLLMFDLTMSLAPTWFSTLWGGWNFAILMQTLMASIVWIMYLLRNTGIGAFIERKHYHDIGKMLFGFTVFFAYLTYAHILTYWYGNVPEETSYFFTRLQSPWLQMLCALLFGTFFIPFFTLIPKAHKWTPYIVLPVATIVLVSQWFVWMLVVIPEVVTPEQWNGPLLDVGVFLGFGGVFLGSYMRFAKNHPMLPVSDPLLLESFHHGH